MQSRALDLGVGPCIVLTLVISRSVYSFCYSLLTSNPTTLLRDSSISNVLIILIARHHMLPLCRTKRNEMKSDLKAAYASEDCIFNPPGAPAMPLGDVLGMMGAMKKAFPDWHSVVSSCVENGDGTVTAITQQCIGTMQADLPAMGPFPAVNLADAPARCKATSAALPREIGTYTFSEDGMKVASGAYEGKVEEGGDPTPWLLEKWNVKGDLTDVGFGILFAWLGK